MEGGGYAHISGLSSGFKYCIGENSAFLVSLLNSEEAGKWGDGVGPSGIICSTQLWSRRIKLKNVVGSVPLHVGFSFADYVIGIPAGKSLCLLFSNAVLPTTTPSRISCEFRQITSTLKFQFLHMNNGNPNAYFLGNMRTRWYNWNKVQQVPGAHKCSINTIYYC